MIIIASEGFLWTVGILGFLAVCGVVSLVIGRAWERGR